MPWACCRRFGPARRRSRPLFSFFEVAARSGQEHSCCSPHFPELLICLPCSAPDFVDGGAHILAPNFRDRRRWAGVLATAPEFSHKRNPPRKALRLSPARQPGGSFF